jgi:hypothetical protein
MFKESTEASKSSRDFLNLNFSEIGFKKSYIQLTIVYLYLIITLMLHNRLTGQSRKYIKK